MRAVLDNRLRIMGICPEHSTVIEQLKNRFTYDNPVYWDARRFRRPCRHIPRRIELFDGPFEGMAAMPRGASHEALRILGPMLEGVEDRTSFPPRSGLVFHGVLRDYQETAVQKAILERQGVIHAPAGSGKTVMALAIIERVPTRALILVHTSVLFEQTAERVRQFLGIEPGLLGLGHERFGDVTIAMVQTMMRRDLSKLADAFGLVILDEAHHCPAEGFKTVVQAFEARYRFGLTATPMRKDRLHPVLFDVIGPIIHHVAPGTLVATGSLTPLEVVVIETDFRAFYKRDYQALVNRIVKNEQRNQLVVDTISRLHRGRSLVLTERVAHAEEMTQRLMSLGLKAVTISGETSREEREVVIGRFSQGEVELLVATTTLVGEGFDIPAIDTVFLTVPNGNIAKTTQVLGRALRPYKGKVVGRIVDFVDVRVPILRSQFIRRQRVYRNFSRQPG